MRRADAQIEIADRRSVRGDDMDTHAEAIRVEPERLLDAGEAIERVERRLGVEHHARSEEHTSELQSLMRISYAVFCLKKKTKKETTTPNISKPAKAKHKRTKHVCSHTLTL